MGCGSSVAAPSKYKYKEQNDDVQAARVNCGGQEKVKHEVLQVPRYSRQAQISPKAEVDEETRQAPDCGCEAWALQAAARYHACMTSNIAGENAKTIPFATQASSGGKEGKLAAIPQKAQCPSFDRINENGYGIVDSRPRIRRGCDILGVETMSDSSDEDLSPCGQEFLSRRLLKRFSMHPGSFESLQVLDATSSCTVYLARHESGVLVALKKVTKQVSHQPMPMHVNEVRALARLDHSCIVKLLGVIDSPRYFEVLLEYCSGGRLSLYLKNGQHQHCPQLLGDIAKALAYMHSKMFVHLDVKPDNLLESSGRGKLCDFGTASTIGPSCLLQGIVGTPGFRAPEINGGDQFLATLADVWSLGKVLEFVEARSAWYWPKARVMLLDRVPKQRPCMSACIRLVTEGATNST